MITSETRAQAFADLEATDHRSWTLRHTALTDVGQRRQVNEDFYLLYPERGLFVVADGMGGHAAGEVASRMVCETLAAYFDETDLPDEDHRQAPQAMGDHLTKAIQIANETIFEEAAQRRERAGMGTTAVALSIYDDRAAWAHVGDSRLYRLRQTKLEPLSRDHSLLEKTLALQELSGAEAAEFTRTFPHKNVLTRAVGSRPDVDVAVDDQPLESGDLFVMTTDGIHDVIGTDCLFDLLYLNRGNWPAACRTIAAETNRRGGPDNLTIACVEVQKMDRQ